MNFQKKKKEEEEKLLAKTERKQGKIFLPFLMDQSEEFLLELC